MAKTNKLREVFGSGRAVSFRRKKMLSFMREHGVIFSVSPSNGDLWGRAKALGFDMATYKPKKENPIIDDMRRKQAVSSKGFYISREWREVRYTALKANNGRCELCGQSKHDGVVLHVDHILPRSKFPKLELEPTNLQVLCEDCNLGKSNKDDTDWRASPPRDDEWLDVRRRLGEA